MKRLLLLILALYVSWQAVADTISVQLSVVRSDTMVASLTWTGIPDGTPCQILRQCPDEAAPMPIATVSSATYTDSINRIVCGDTVFYQVAAAVNGTTYLSAVEGDYFDDLWPTSGCGLRVATVEEASQQILLSWDASPDADIMGYYLCTGSPCLDYDTVWGRLNTSYRCLDIQPTEVRTFRVLAFDSCYKASPLTDPFNNIVLQVDGADCSRRVTVSWNAYQNMPQGVADYTLYYANGAVGTDFRPLAVFDSSQQRIFEWDVPDSIFHFRMKVVAENGDRTLRSVSNIVTVNIVAADTADFLELTAAAYDPQTDCVDLSFRVDASHHADEYLIYRKSGIGEWSLLAQLPYTGMELLEYSDCDLPFGDTLCHYRLSVFDSCGIYEQFSNTVAVSLPEAVESTLFFPNVFRPQDPLNVLFCPVGSHLDSQTYELNIFDRQGLLVFHTKTFGACWDGTSRGIAVPQGTYVYHFRCRLSNNREKTVVGTVLLLR